MPAIIVPAMLLILLHFNLLHYLYCLPVQHSHSRDNGWVSRLKGVGEIITTVRLACGALFGSFLFAEVRSDECHLMILGVGGICQKSYLLLVPPSNMVGVDHPDCDAWELTFHLVLFAKIADTTSR